MKKTLIALAAVLHLIPHPFSVSPVGALALYAGAFGSNRLGWLTPMLPMAVAAIVFGFYEPIIMLFVFGGFGLSTFAGRWLLRGDRNYTRFGAAVVLGAFIFYLVSNFSVWLAGMYPPTMAGLAACYIAGLPTFLQAIAADAAYCFVLFGLHALIERYEGEAIAV